VAGIICQVLDLGAYPFLTTVTVEVTPTFSSADDELIESFLALTSWNLCTTQLFPDDGETCWFAAEQVMTGHTAGGLSRTSTRPTSNRQTESARLYEPLKVSL